MSIEIDWDKLLENGAELSEKIRIFLDNQFQALDLPPYIASVSVTSFDLGTNAPDIVIKDICDPFPEFYNDESLQEASAHLAAVEFASRRHSIAEELYPDPSRLRAPVSPSSESIRASASASAGAVQSQDPASDDYIGLSPDPPHYFYPSFLPSSVYNAGLTSPRRGVYSPSLGPSRASAMLQVSSHPHPHPSSPPLFPPSSGSVPTSTSASASASASTSAFASTSASTSASTFTSTSATPTPSLRPNSNTNNTGPATANDNPDAHSSTPSPNDVQFLLQIAYSGNMQLGVSATLQLNHPTPGFVSLPLKLSITGVKVNSLAVLASISNRICLSFICDLQDKLDQNQSQDQPDGESSSTPDLSAAGLATLSQDKIDILKELHIESEIGHVPTTGGANGASATTNSGGAGIGAANGSGTVHDINNSTVYNGIPANGDDSGGMGPVLRNVGKVEKFLLDRLRSIARDELAWPGWLTIEI